MPYLSKFVFLTCATLVGAALLLLPASPVHAQAPAKNAALLEANKRVTEAQENLKLVKVDETRFRDKLTAEFSEKEEWKNTVADQKKAKANYDKVQRNALTAMKSKPEYKQAVKERDATKAKLDAAKEPDEITKLGSELSKRAIAVKNMEKEAQEQDPKVLEAKEALAAADKQLKAMNEDIDGALATDPDYVAVKQRVDEAELQLKQATEARTAQVKADSATKRQSRPAPAPRASRKSAGY